MRRLFLVCSFFLIFFNSIYAFSPSKQIALTIDDLPFVGEEKSFHLDLITKTLKEKQVPATGFVIAKEINQDNSQALLRFKTAGLSVGNHSFSHLSVNEVSTENYIAQQINGSDQILSPFLTSPKFFRFPYLNMGTGEKKQRILAALSAKGYHIAPITTDSKDFIFNQLLLSVAEKDRRQFMISLVPCYINFIWEQTLKVEEENLRLRRETPQILLIHANLLNAYALETLIDFYREKGYKFITISEALRILTERASI